MMSHHFPQSERNSTLSSEGTLTKHLNRGMVAAVAATLSNHIVAKMVEVVLVSVTNGPQSMIARVRYVQHRKAT